MNIELFEHGLDAYQASFFSYVFDALKQEAGAVENGKPRPVPKVMKPREMTSAWADFGGKLVFFDMSDHLFVYDIPALEKCDLYFKTNLHRGMQDKVLEQEKVSALADKVRPFFSFAGELDQFRADSLPNRLLSIGRREQYDVCHIVGVYENLLAQQEESVFERGGTPSPNDYHFWIRYHTNVALKEAGINGYYRLTSRHNPGAEHEGLIHPNLSLRQYMQKLLASRFTVINTLPHALLPWKATESLAMKRPIIIERSPLVEIPDAFALVEGDHYLAWLPEAGTFDLSRDMDDVRAYRVLNPLTLDYIQERAEWLRKKLEDRALVKHMQEAAAVYAGEKLSKRNVAEYLAGEVEQSG